MPSTMTSRLVRAITPWVLPVIPVSQRIVVHGWRDGEENALRVVGALTRRASSQTRITMLCETPAEARRHLMTALRHVEWSPSRVHLVRKNSLRGYLHFLRARVVLMTHGLYGNPAPGHRRLHVLLGHGHGPKSGQAPDAPHFYATQLNITNNAVWGRAVIESQIPGVPATIAVTGNPRDDAFDEPHDRARLSALGINPQQRFVLWLPTYRPDRVDVTESMPDSATQKLERLRSECARHGIQLVTKAHQLDDERNALSWGMHVVTSESLLAAGVSFMQLLAMSDGLVSDYSSVWVDYLRTGKPFGLLFPDFEMFARGRGFNEPSIPEVAGEAIFRDAEVVTAFVAAVRHHDEHAATPPSIRTASRLGLITAPGSTGRVIDAVEAECARLGIPPLLRPQATRS